MFASSNSRLDKTWLASAVVMCCVAPFCCCFPNFVINKFCKKKIAYAKLVKLIIYEDK